MTRLKIIEYLLIGHCIYFSQSTASDLGPRLPELAESSQWPCCVCIARNKCQKGLNGNSTSEQFHSKGILSINAEFNTDSCANPSEVCCGVVGPHPSCNNAKDPRIRSKRRAKTRRRASAATIEDGVSYGEHFWYALILQTVHIGSKHAEIFISSGSLIHPQVVMTSAHSIYRKEKAVMTVRVGDFNPLNEDERHPHQDRKIKSIIIHPNYDNETSFADIALIFLEEPISGANLDVMRIPENLQNVKLSKCKIINWKKYSGPKLVAIKSEVFTNQQCEEEMENLGLIQQRFTHLGQPFICAKSLKSVDKCEIDEGSPLLCEDGDSSSPHLQIGIFARQMIDCESQHSPFMFSSIAEHYAWIRQSFVRTGLLLDPPKKTLDSVAPNKTFHIGAGKIDEYDIAPNPECFNRQMNKKIKFLRCELTMTHRKLCESMRGPNESFQEMKERCNVWKINRQVKKMIKDWKKSTKKSKSSTMKR